ncbi:fructose-specific PTS transporter subunit EIIC [Parendozoicomonas haliclonae]|uniref:protein-N(pi)-phosphohistidine--D-fructose phosphotransferase n=1 Tax=Parendozoicomonas haliclonae TaxID=1960125 RepID=A0A1X7ARM8_9GAMM|nr:fructose-specific PTS transporter subunit EIIC [Parendozoicomonas haliclonae]SMA50749.1 PTS system fructose-specific EIIBC component [Parendozoicomonas haliclonae]
MNVLIYTRCPTGLASSYLAGESLSQSAEALGWNIRKEIHSQLEPATPFTTEEIYDADLILVAASDTTDLARFAGKKLYQGDMQQAISQPAQWLERANKEAKVYKVEEASAKPDTSGPSEKPAETSDSAPEKPASLNILAVTACPTGVAHTFMAAEALQATAEQMGHHIQIETRGSVGAKGTFTPAEIAKADLVILAVDIEIDASAFAGKRIYRTSTGKALKQTRDVIETAIKEAKVEDSSTASSSSSTSKEKTGPYKHLMTGVSFMLPMVVAGGLIIAISFMFGIHAAGEPGTLAAALMTIGGKSAFALMIPVLSGYIAFSIADRPGLAPGLIGGMLASSVGAGFLGGIVSGFLAGYSAKALADHVRLPKTMEALKPILVIPLFGSLITGLIMIYVVGDPVAAIMKGLENFLSSMGDANAVILGLLLGAMMCFDLGGPVNKAAYAFGVGLLASKQYEPMAAIMAAGMTPAIGMGIATFLGKSHFSEPEHEAGRASFILGLCFISEGAIPFAAKDPIRVIPAAMVGGAITGALSMFWDIQLMAPHGGIFVLFIPNAISHVLLYAVAIAIGSIITGLGYLLMMKLYKHKEEEIVEV